MHLSGFHQGEAGRYHSSMPVCACAQHGSTGDADPREPRDVFLELLSRHRSELFNLIFCIVRTLPDAEDVFQQTAMAMWADFNKFQPGSDFMAWASQVARYRAWNFARDRRRERLYFSEALIQQLAECSDETSEVYEARLQALSKCREKLPIADQRLIQLCYGGGSIIAVAKEIGQSPSAIYSRLFRIRRALFVCIERTLARENRT
jgi:RNA polymerase sigma-70 factor (ECF subfamily)